MEYVDRITFLQDARIVLLTAKKMVVREGVSSGTSVTMEEFKGTPAEVDSRG